MCIKFTKKNVIETSQISRNLNRLIQSDHNSQITIYGYDIFGRRISEQSQIVNQN